MDYKFLLSPGHGGMCFDHYVTPGKRSPGVPPGIYEGEFNRLVCQAAKTYMGHAGIDAEIIAPGPINIPLDTRIEFVNQIAKREKVALICVHANASPEPGWSDANGSVVFRSGRAGKKSKRLSMIMQKQLVDGPDPIIRPRYERVQIVNHRETTRTTCPAIYVEGGFMTNFSEAAYLASYAGQQKFGYTLSVAAWNFNNEK